MHGLEIILEGGTGSKDEASRKNSSDQETDDNSEYELEMGREICLLPERYVMVLLCAVCCFINYADRVNMSVAVIAIGDEFGYNIKERGFILSAFFLGYIPMQIGGAILCRRYGGKKVLMYGAFFWSLFTILTPFSCWLGLGPLLVCRIFMGLAEGVAFPSVFHFLSFWVPASERGFSTSVFLTGAHIGTTVALVVSPVIIRLSSWHFIFYSFGAAGMLWIIAWTMIAYDRDELKRPSSSSMSLPETPLAQPELGDKVPFLESRGPRRPKQNTSIESGDEEGNTVADLESDMPARHLRREGTPSCLGIMAAYINPTEIRTIRFVLSNRKTLTICLSQCIFGLIHYIILSWLPSYFQEVYNKKTESLSFTFAPYLSMAIASNIGGIIADRLVSNGVATTKVRKGMTIVANAGAALTLVLFSLARTVPMALVFISLSMSFMSFNTGGFESSYMDMSSPELTGIFKATANTLGSFSGFVAIPFSTWILEWSGNSWRFTFGSLSIWYVLMTILFVSFATSERILVEGQLDEKEAG
eukprot:GFKZ01011362.1.p1 GENE.GFKZ01011362.1~~GFKZ01011362.1.p1  ORF type:complete len:531 (+),score=45.00 GFKZ01011362.1:163-1755(+)